MVIIFDSLLFASKLKREFYKKIKKTNTSIALYCLSVTTISN